METAAPASHVLPNPRIPRTLGILNIVFASGLLIAGLCFAASNLLSPLLMARMEGLRKENLARVEAQRKVRLKTLEKAEQAAPTEAEKQEIHAQRKELEATKSVDPMAGLLDPRKIGLDDPRLRAWVWTEGLTGLVLNVLMLASGIGLVQLRPWGRSLGLGTAGLKCLRLVLVYGYAILVLIPAISKMLGQFVGEMITQQYKSMGRPIPPGLSVEFYAQMYGIMYTVMAVGMILFGSIYPLVSLWLLTKPGARAACSGAKPAQGADGTW